MTNTPTAKLLDAAIAARASLFDTRHEGAFRLFNGFYEGCATLVVDLYARTAVVHNYADPPAAGDEAVRAARELILERLPWVRTVVLKTRNGKTMGDKRGVLIHGITPDRRIVEFGVRYAVDLLMNRDASFYLDTRNLRQWALENLAGKAVLNTFAYTGSLGVAALASGAARVVQADLNRQFLNVAKSSCVLNGFPICKKDFQTADFWPHISRLKRANERFDCIFLDPPFFAVTGQGRVDLASNCTRLINKVRPLLNDGGFLVAVNNALFVSGAGYMAELEAICADGYVSVAKLIPVPEDFIGYGDSLGAPPCDPAPFNHSTKIALLQVRRKAS